MTRRIALLLAAAVCASCGAPSAEDLRNDPHGHLVWAARTGDVAAIRQLAASGVDLSASSATALKFVFPDFDHMNSTPLQHAVRKHQVEAVRVLLEWGAEPDAMPAGGATPLLIAVGSQDPTIAGLLLDAGADVDKVGPQDDGAHTPLTQAMSTGLFGGCRTETVRTLLNAGATRTPNTAAWNSAIWWVRMRNCDKVLELIESPKDGLAGQRATSAASRP
jgi:ankyrin repeat protein